MIEPIYIPTNNQKNQPTSLHTGAEIARRVDLHALISVILTSYERV
jgi:hypothetical protein